VIQSIVFRCHICVYILIYCEFRCVALWPAWHIGRNMQVIKAIYKKEEGCIFGNENSSNKATWKWVKIMGRYCTCRSLNVIAAELKHYPFVVNVMIELKKKYYYYIRQHWHPAGYVSTNMCAGIVGYSCNIFELNRSINYKWHFLSCVSIAFSERCVGHFRHDLSVGAKPRRKSGSICKLLS
jgi:hypothetical protein